MIAVLAAMIVSNFAFAEAGKQNIRFGLQYVSPTGDHKESDYEAGPVDLDVYIPEPIDDFVLVTATDLSYTRVVEADAAMTFFFGYEYMVTDIIGIDANLSFGKHDIDAEEKLGLTWEAEGTGDYEDIIKYSGDMTMMPITVGVNFHVMQKEKVDLYVGPFLGYVTYGDIKLDKITHNITVTGLDPDPITATYSESVSEKVKVKSDFGFGAVVGMDVPFGNNWMFNAALKYFQTKAKTDETNPVEIDMNPWVIQIGVGYQF